MNPFLQFKTLKPYFSFYALFAIICAALFMYVRIRLIDIPFERDEGEYTYAAQEILRGKIPYHDFYNMKTPLVYYTIAVWFKLFGDSVHTVKIGLLLMNFASAFFIFLTGKKLYAQNTGYAAAGIFLILTVSSRAQGWTANAEHFVIFYAMIGLYFAASAYLNFSKGTIFWSGFFMMLAFLCKQQAIGFCVFPMLWLLSAHIKSYSDKKETLISTIKNYGIKVILYAIGTLVPFGIMAIYLTLNHALYDAYHLCYQYAQEYGAQYHNFQLLTYFEDICKNNSVFWAMVLGCVILLMSGFKSNMQNGFLILLLLCCFGATSVGLLFRPHYFQFLFPSAAFMAGYFATHLSRWKFIEITLLFLGLNVSKNTQKNYFFHDKLYQIDYDGYGYNFFSIKKQLGLELPYHVKDANATVGMFGNEPQIYFYSKLQSASGFFYLYPMIENHPYAQQMMDVFIRETEKNKPEICVFFDGTVPWSNYYTSIAVKKWFDTFILDYKPIGQIYVENNQPILDWKPANDTLWKPKEHPYALIYQK